MKQQEDNYEGIEARVKNSFGEHNDSEVVSKYLEWLYGTMSAYSQGIRRNVTILLALVIAFELVVQSPKARLSLGTFQIYRGSVLLIFLPQLVAYLYMQAAIDSNKLKRVKDAFRQVFHVWTSSAQKNGLDVLILPPSPIYSNTWRGELWHDKYYRKGNRTEVVGSIILLIIMYAAFLAFEVQAYYDLFRSNIDRDILWIASLLITVLCLVLTYMHGHAERVLPGGKFTDSARFVLTGSVDGNQAPPTSATEESSARRPSDNADPGQKDHEQG